MPKGIVTVNVLPSPSTLSTRTVPPWRLTSSCTSARPMPVPSYVRPRLLLDAVEALEHARQFVGRDADAGVAHRQARLAVSGVHAHVDVACPR